MRSSCSAQEDPKTKTELLGLFATVETEEQKYLLGYCKYMEIKLSNTSFSSTQGTQKLTQPQLESDSYIKEKPFKFTLKIPINSPNSSKNYFICKTSIQLVYFLFFHVICLIFVKYKKPKFIV